MEINYKSELVAYWMKTYDFSKAMANTQKMVGQEEEAKNTAKCASIRAIGAMEQIVYMLNNNGYSDVAGEIIDLWENGWQKNFQNLMED